MNPTRALIDKAEEALELLTRLGHKYADFNKEFEAAISSAKAAEEGVETTYEAQFFSEYGGDWITDYPGIDCEQATERVKSLSLRWKSRAVEKNTYTTVIEVREKEGL